MHDAAMLAESGFLQDLTAHAFSPTGRPLCVYGDPAYPLRMHLQARFRNAGRLTEQMELFNTSMSKVRMSVEWIFGHVINDFKFLDFKKNLKVGLSAVGEMYVVGAILPNCLTCLYGNQTAEHFDVNPPALEDYLNGYYFDSCFISCSAF